jgi:hypothetical protein
MSAPPRLAVWILEATIPTEDGAALAGDLCEEFTEHIAPARGAAFARRWYCWQVARSLAPLWVRSWERASLARASIAVVGAGLAATMPAAALVALRAFVLQQVPLKTTAEFSPLFGVALLIVVLLTALVGLSVAVRCLQACHRK